MSEGEVKLYQTIEDDLNVFFEFQIDSEAIYMAAFTPVNPFDKIAYIDKYLRLLSDPTIHMCTIKVDKLIVGSISKFDLHGDNEITYWIDKSFWGKGIATVALREFLKVELSRPIYGRTAFDNLGSQKVLLSNGFEKIRTDKGFAYGRGEEIEEFIYMLSK